VAGLEFAQLQELWWYQYSGWRERGGGEGGRDGRSQGFLLQKDNIHAFSSRISQNFLLFLYFFRS